MAKKSNQRVRSISAQKRREQEHRRAENPYRTRLAGLNTRRAQEMARRMAAGEDPALTAGTYVLVREGDQLRPVVLIDTAGEEIVVLRLALHRPGSTRRELTDRAGILARRTDLVRRAVRLPRSAALRALGHLTYLDRQIVGAQLLADELAVAAVAA